jgi:hypothetical protein
MITMKACRSLDLDGWCHDPLFAPARKRRGLVRPKGKEGAIRRGQERRATPPWADRKAIAALYAEARRLTELTGELHVVDHTVPLVGKLGGVQIVSGLHVDYTCRSSIGNRTA